MTNLAQQAKPAAAVLIVGATGGTGLALIRELAQHPSHPKIFGFCRNPDRMPAAERKLCATVYAGDARYTQDLERAVVASKASIVMVSIGNGENVAKSDIRTVSGQALSKVLQDNASLQHVQVVVVSSTGAGPSRIIVGYGVGSMISWYLRHVLRDHTGQEEAFMGSMPSRTLIVRATYLTDEQATGNLVVFGNTDKSPSTKTDRADLSAWIVNEVLSEKQKYMGSAVNVTGVAVKAT